MNSPKIDSYCQNAGLITPTKKDVDVMSDKLVIQLYRHNSIYEKLCGEK